MLSETMQRHLETRILPFWEGLADQENGGFYGYVDKDLRVRRDAHKGCILNSRILWTFSTAARVTGNRRYLRFAEHALDFMARFEDSEGGGVYWSVTAQGEPLDKTKHTYCQAFAIYGLAAYLRAADPAGERYRTARERALRLFEVIERRCRDEGGYGEAFEPDFTPVGNEKLSDNPVLMARGETAQRTMNTLLHVLEAYAELYRALPEETVRQAGRACLETALRRVYDPEKGRLEVFFDRGYRSLLDMQSFGHDIEASWLMWDAAQTLLNEAEQAPYRAMCLRLAQTVRARAWTDHGLENEVVEGVVEHTRVWWVQAETVLGFANAYDLSNDPAWLALAEQQYRYIERYVADPRPGGEWFWSLSEDGTPTEKPIVEEWKCPYHNGRMCLRLMEQGK